MSDMDMDTIKFRRYPLLNYEDLTHASHDDLDLLF